MFYRQLRLAENYPEMAKDLETIYVTILAHFIWDEAYVFSPGTTKKDIEDIIGFEDRNIPLIIVEGNTQMLFVLREPNKVVCSLHDERPYIFDFSDTNLKTDGYIMIPLSNAQFRFVNEGAQWRLVFEE